MVEGALKWFEVMRVQMQYSNRSMSIVVTLPVRSFPIFIDLGILSFYAEMENYNNAELWHRAKLKTFTGNMGFSRVTC